jgi:hypothetical protein
MNAGGQGRVTPVEFRQRILVYDAFWTRPSGPLLMFVGGEAACEDFYDNSGAMFDIAREVGGLVAFLEHRCVRPCNACTGVRMRGERYRIQVRARERSHTHTHTHAHTHTHTHTRTNTLHRLNDMANRYYGTSLPFATADDSYSDRGLRFLTVEQVSEKCGS